MVQVMGSMTHGMGNGQCNSQYNSWYGQHTVQLVVQVTHSATYSIGNTWCDSWQLVFKSPVRSGFFPFLGATRTATGCMQTESW